jgi:ribosome-associated protein
MGHTPNPTDPMPDALIPLLLDEMAFSAIRAQGAGGQNVNKVSTAIHLRYDIGQSSLPEPIKERLLALSDQRITGDGVVVIKAQTTRSQEQNKADAIARLQALVDSVAVLPKARKATKPTRSSQRKRLEGKSTRGDVKKLRGKVSGSD